MNWIILTIAGCKQEDKKLLGQIPEFFLAGLLLMISLLFSGNSGFWSKRK